MQTEHRSDAAPDGVARCAGCGHPFAASGETRCAECSLDACVSKAMWEVRRRRAAWALRRAGFVTVGIGTLWALGWLMWIGGLTLVEGRTSGELPHALGVALSGLGELSISALHFGPWLVGLAWFFTAVSLHRLVAPLGVRAWRLAIATLVLSALSELAGPLIDRLLPGSVVWAFWFWAQLPLIELTWALFLVVVTWAMLKTTRLMAGRDGSAVAGMAIRARVAWIAIVTLCAVNVALVTLPSLMATTTLGSGLQFFVRESLNLTVALALWLCAARAASIIQPQRCAEDLSESERASVRCIRCWHTIDGRAPQDGRCPECGLTVRASRLARANQPDTIGSERWHRNTRQALGALLIAGLGSLMLATAQAVELAWPTVGWNSLGSTGIALRLAIQALLLISAWRWARSGERSVAAWSLVVAATLEVVVGIIESRVPGTAVRAMLDPLGVFGVATHALLGISLCLCLGGVARTLNAKVAFIMVWAMFLAYWPILVMGGMRVLLALGFTEPNRRFTTGAEAVAMLRPLAYWWPWTITAGRHLWEVPCLLAIIAILWRLRRIRLHGM